MISIFPSELPVGQFFASSKYVPRNVRERLLATWQNYRALSAQSAFIVTGWTISAGSGLAVNLSTGDVIVNGLWVNSDAVQSCGSLSANRGLGQTVFNPNFIWGTLQRDANSLVTGIALAANTTGTPPSATDSIFLGAVATNASAVTAVAPAQVQPRFHSGNYTGSGTVGTPSVIYCGFVPKEVRVFGHVFDPAGPSNEVYGMAWNPAASGRGFSTYAGVTTNAYDIPLISGFGFQVEHIEPGSDKRGLNIAGEVYDWQAWA